MNNLPQNFDTRYFTQKIGEINSKAIRIINEWRAGSKTILNKINANGQPDAVTNADIAIEQMANDIFADTMPVFGEEKFKYDFSLPNKQLYAIIDPIDGTKEFVKGSKDWSISICIVQNGSPVIASILMPDKNEHYTAIKGEGTRLNGHTYVKRKSPKHIAVSPRQIKKEPFASKINNLNHLPKPIPALTPKICAMLRGEIGAAVYFPEQNQSAALWDYAAATLLISEFGGRLTSLNGQELPFTGTGIIHREGWIATSHRTDHQQLIDLL